MSASPGTFSNNVYEEDLIENSLDLSCRDLEIVPKFRNTGLVALYLQNNKLEKLPDDFFPTLKFLMYLDLRDNRLTEIPTTIKNHQGLTHLLLQNNHITHLPDELGTLIRNLKVLQVNGNPLVYPPTEIINGGVSKILKFLHDKFIDKMFAASNDVKGKDAEAKTVNDDGISYNSVIDGEKIKNLKIGVTEKTENERDEFNGRLKGKCYKLGKSRYIPGYCQSSKYLKPLIADNKKTREEKIKENYFKQITLEKKKNLLEKREKVLQDRRTLEHLKNWRAKYRYGKMFTDATYKLKPESFPYDTSPEYMTLLTREDIERDLPDKYRKNIVRRVKRSVPRKSSDDVQLAIKIKQLFENLGSMNLNTDLMTPRSEQKALMKEIHKISEIKQKLHELSLVNMSTPI